MQTDADLRQLLLVFQANEITEYHIYKRLAKSIKSPQNRAILEKIAEDEPFRRRFFEMAGLSLTVATFSFVIGYFIRSALGIEI
jgi:rubrerythrin